MSRHMSFTLTTEQIRNRTKTVTRRTGWKFLKPGDVLWAVEKSQGLKKGEKVKKLCRIRVASVRREPLWDITDDDLSREGFPGMPPSSFCLLFRQANGGSDAQTVTRIEFEYIDEEPTR